MHLLVTAGNTWAMLDRVRCLTNIFSGRTGAAIACAAWKHGHRVTLLTSHPEAVADVAATQPTGDHWQVTPYQTFEDLASLLKSSLQTLQPHAVIHGAAVSDYLSGGVYAPADTTSFDPTRATWVTSAGGSPTLVDRQAAKVKSDAPELWLRLVKAPKLVDAIRPNWGFQGVLVKFKLEVGIDEATLQSIAEQSRVQSAADLMVANTLESARDWALLGPESDGAYHKIHRAALPETLLSRIEQLQKERNDGQDSPGRDRIGRGDPHPPVGG